MPDIAAFKSTFTPACNAHDKCYTTLGTSYGECNGSFKSNMEAACKSKFDSLLQPVERAACLLTAQRYHTAVELHAAIVNPLPGFQQDALNRSKATQTDLATNICGTTPTESTLFSTALTNTINSTFLTYANRKPTVFEFFEAANVGNVVVDYSAWVASLQWQASQAASRQAPMAAYARQNNEYAITLTASPDGTDFEYQWKVDRSGATNTTSQSLSIPLTNPKYDTRWEFSGYLVVKNKFSGVKDLVLIRESVFERGWCAAKPGLHCSN